jgi:hypothetical protein
MPDWSNAGKLIACIGIVLTLVGVFITVLGKFSGGLGWLGKLPGDILIKRDSFSFYFPLTTSILISVIVSVLAYLLSTFKR